MPRVRGSREGRYELLDLIGRGGMGEVWKARHVELDRTVAYKRLQRSTPDDLVRFRREAQAVARLSHPNIAPIYEFSADPPFIAMQFIDGAPIGQAPARGIADRIRPLADAARAVQHAHDQNILHRDLKPANILVDSNGRGFVVDFGLARQVHPDETVLSLTGDVIGTPSYMAPEQARGDVRRLDARSDVYGLGATLYALLAGRPPHTGPDVYDLLRRVVEEDPLPPGGPHDLQVVCLKAMDKDSSRRYASAAEFADDLDRFLRGEAALARPASLLYRLRRRIALHPAVWTLAALLLLSVIGGSVFGAKQIAARIDAEARRVADFEAREAARPHLDEARRLRSRLEWLLASPDADPAEARISADALAELDLALAACAGLPEAHLERGRILRARGDLAGAREAFSRAVDTSPELATARIERVLLDFFNYEMMRHASDSGGTRAETAESAALRRTIEADLDAVRRWSADVAEHDLTRGFLLFSEGDFAGAAEAVGAYLDRDPTNAEAFYWRGHALNHAGQHQTAVDAFTRGIRLRPRLYYLWIERGEARRLSGDPAGAVADFDAALRLKPGTVPARVNRAMALSMLGDHRQALTECDAVVEARPGAARIRKLRGQARRESGDLLGALEDYEAAARMRPGDAEMRILAGYVLRDLGRLDEGAAAFASAMPLDPAGAEPYIGRGAIRVQLGDLRGALSDFNEALRIDPARAEGRKSRAAVRYFLNDFAGDVEDANEAIRLDPGDADSHVYRGTARVALGDPAGAETDFTRAIELDATNADAWLNRGVVRHGRGDPRGADDLERGLDLRPDHPSADVFRGWIEELRGDF